jgi:Ser/Thr protein kinase RdoA (MazF antagonist)
MLPRHSDWLPTDAEVAKAFARLGPAAVDRGTQFRGSFNRAFPYTDAEGRRRVLRLRPRWLTEGRIRFEHALASHLAARGVPVLPPVVLHTGGTWLRVGNCYAEVYPFISGRDGQPCVQDADLSGTVLAQFHRAAAGFAPGGADLPEVQNQAAAPELLSLLAELDSPAACDEPLASLLPAAQPALNYARSRLRELHARDGGVSLPVTVRHGDPHIWNFICSADEPARVLALLDLDMAAEGPRCFDLSYALYFLLLSTAPDETHPPSLDDAWRPLCQQLTRGYAEFAEAAMERAEAAVTCLQMHCIAANFLYWDIARATDPSGVAAACQQYRAMAGWLDAHEAEMTALVAGA